MELLFYLNFKSAGLFTLARSHVFTDKQKRQKHVEEFSSPSTKNGISEPSWLNLSRLNSRLTKNTIEKLICVAFLEFEPV